MKTLKFISSSSSLCVCVSLSFSESLKNSPQLLSRDAIVIFQEYLVPQEYVHTMRESMLNRCPVSSYDQVCEVFKKELGGKPNEVCISTYLFLANPPSEGN